MIKLIKDNSHDDIFIERLIAVIIKDIENIYANERYNDNMFKDVATLQEQLKFYIYGLHGTLPDIWGKYIVQVKHELDPEYQEYLRLKHKFENNKHR